MNKDQKKLKIAALFALPALALAVYLLWQNQGENQGPNLAEQLTKPEAGETTQHNDQDRAPAGMAGPAAVAKPKAKLPSAKKEVAQLNDAPEAKCFSQTYTHKKMNSHASGEACTQHNNILKLDHNGINSKSVCVRVNGTPVKHSRIKGKKNLIMIGAVAGPHAEIKVSYCTGALTCKETCKVPRDEFMDAIGAAGPGGNDGYVAHWEPGAKKISKDEANVEKELKDMKAILSAGGKKAAFKGWVSKKTANSCSG